MSNKEPGFAYIPLNQLAPNSYNARRFEENMTPQRRARFAELVESIRGKGIIEPLLVRPLVDDRYEVIAGERRYRAALQIAEGMDHSAYRVPCMVRDVNDDEAFDLMVVENLQREDLTPFETAQALHSYLKRHGGGSDVVADLSVRTGIPTHAIRLLARIIELPQQVVDAWKAGALTQSHAELLVRVGDEEQVLELCQACLRMKLTVRELAERIGSISPDLDKGFFDKAECQTCPHNTSVQSSLFAEVASTGKCSHARCFEEKQETFFTENWGRSKTCEKFGTLGFRFGHRLALEHRQLAGGGETNGRCLECETFVSVLRVTGAVISGYERTCIGPRACFESLYCEKPPVEVEPEAVEPASAVPTLEPAKEPTKEKTPPTAKETKPAAPPAETGPVFSAVRGNKAREAFFKESLSDAVAGTYKGAPRNLQLAILALADASAKVRGRLCAGLGVEKDKPATRMQLAERIFEIADADLQEEIQLCALAYMMESSVLPQLRQLAAVRYGVDLQGQWKFNAAYLEELSKQELVQIGEEPGVDIWQDEKAKAYRKEHFKGKALLSLKKEDLVDIILKSGAELAGKVPAEVLGARKG